MMGCLLILKLTLKVKFMVLLTCMTPVYWTFTFMVIDSFQYFRNEDLPNAIIHSVMALSKETFNLSVVRKGMLEMACNGRRKFC